MLRVWARQILCCPDLVIDRPPSTQLGGPTPAIFTSYRLEGITELYPFEFISDRDRFTQDFANWAKNECLFCYNEEEEIKTALKMEFHAASVNSRDEENLSEAFLGRSELSIAAHPIQGHFPHIIKGIDLGEFVFRENAPCLDHSHFFDLSALQCLNYQYDSMDTFIRNALISRIQKTVIANMDAEVDPPETLCESPGLVDNLRSDREIFLWACKMERDPFLYPKKGRCTGAAKLDICKENQLWDIDGYLRHSWTFKVDHISDEAFGNMKKCLDGTGNFWRFYLNIAGHGNTRGDPLTIKQYQGIAEQGCLIGMGDISQVWGVEVNSQVQVPNLSVQHLALEILRSCPSLPSKDATCELILDDVIRGGSFVIFAVPSWLARRSTTTRSEERKRMQRRLRRMSRIFAEDDKAYYSCPTSWAVPIAVCRLARKYFPPPDKLDLSGSIVDTKSSTAFLRHMVESVLRHVDFVDVSSVLGSDEMAGNQLFGRTLLRTDQLISFERLDAAALEEITGSCIDPLIISLALPHRSGSPFFECIASTADRRLRAGDTPNWNTFPDSVCGRTADDMHNTICNASTNTKDGVKPDGTPSGMNFGRFCPLSIFKLVRAKLRVEFGQEEHSDDRLPPLASKLRFESKSSSMRLYRNLWRFAQYYHDARLNRCYQSMKEFIDFAPLGIIFILYIYVKIVEKYNMGPANLRRMFRILTKWCQAWILSYKHPKVGIWEAGHQTHVRTEAAVMILDDYEVYEELLYARYSGPQKCQFFEDREQNPGSSVSKRSETKFVLPFSALWQMIMQDGGPSSVGVLSKNVEFLMMQAQRFQHLHHEQYSQQLREVVNSTACAKHQTAIICLALCVLVV